MLSGVASSASYLDERNLEDFFCFFEAILFPKFCKTNTLPLGCSKFQKVWHFSFCFYLDTECLAAIAHYYWWLAFEAIVDANSGSKTAVFNTALGSQNIINALNNIGTQEQRRGMGNVQKDTSKEGQEEDGWDGHQGPENVTGKIVVAEHEAGNVKAETAHEPRTGFPEDASFDQEAGSNEDGETVDEMHPHADAKDDSWGQFELKMLDKSLIKPSVYREGCIILIILLSHRLF